MAPRPPHSPQRSHHRTHDLPQPPVSAYSNPSARSTSTFFRNGRPVSNVFKRRPSSILVSPTAPAPVLDLQSRREGSGQAAASKSWDAQPRPRQREDPAAPSEWSTLGTGRRRSFASRVTPSSPSHSREASSASDTSFAKPDAGPTPAQLAAPLFPPEGEPGYAAADVTGAPSMARQETLRAIERPWMATTMFTRAVGPPKSPQELRETYYGKMGSMTRKQSADADASVQETEAPAGTVKTPGTPPRRRSLLDTPRTPPTGMRRLSLVPSPGPSPHFSRRPSVASGRSQSQTNKPLPTPRPSTPPPPPLLPYVPFPASSPAASLAVPDGPTPSRAKSIDEIIAEHAPPSYFSSRRASAPPRPPSLHETTAIPPLEQSSVSVTETLLPPRSPTSSRSSLTASAEPFGSERELACLLNSPRLTRLFTLCEPPNVGLTVSLADVGSPSGHPVLVFLGLGSTRYLVALYDELADALGLRLICVDRWGLGRTGDVPDTQKRGFVEWATVLAELVSPAHLNLEVFSVLAHSAGAPYAVAASVHAELAPRVRGALHLLAPWVSTSADSLAGPYRYLKHVPAPVLKAAQAAEWKVQGWRLGKPPARTTAPAPVGWDARTGRLMNGEELALEDCCDEVDEVGQGVVLPHASTPTSFRSRGRRTSWGGLFGGVESPSSKNSDGGIDSLETASPGSRTSFLSLSPTPQARRTSWFGNKSRLSTAPDADNRGTMHSVLPSGLPSAPSRRSSLFSTSPSASPTSASFRRSSLSSSVASSLGQSGTTSRAGPASPTAEHRRRAVPPSALIDGLLRASHAESLSGTTADLLVLLERTTAAPNSPAGRPRGQAPSLGFAYGEVPHRAKVWYGERDDRISLVSIRWLERELDQGLAGAIAGMSGAKGCEVRVVEGADHSLMTHGHVMVDVLMSIADECGGRRTYGSRSKAEVSI